MPEGAQPAEGGRREQAVETASRETPAETATRETPAAEPGKQVSRVELYLDLVFVLAIGQLAELVVALPRWPRVAGTLGLFVMLWWTWVGFAVLYNRSAVDDHGSRLLFLLASVPVAAAAVGTHPAIHGHIAAFALSLAAARALLALARLRDDTPEASRGDALRRRNALAYGISTGLLVASVWVPSPFRYLLWALACAQESRAMFDTGSRSRSAASGDTIDARHFAERFGLFIIILLGEVFLQVGDATSAAGDHPSLSAWAGLVAAACLAGALWWSYFDITAEVDLRVLEVSGGSPTTARVIFAVGHMLPAFGLLLTASAAGLLTRPHPPGVAYWLGSIGVGIFLSSTRATVHVRSRRDRAGQAVFSIVVFGLGALRHLVDPIPFLWILAAWTALATGWTTLVAARRGLDPEAAAESLIAGQRHPGRGEPVRTSRPSDG